MNPEPDVTGAPHHTAQIICERMLIELPGPMPAANWNVVVESVLPPNSQNSPRSPVHKKNRRVRRASRRLAYSAASACTHNWRVILPWVQNKGHS